LEAGVNMEAVKNKNVITHRLTEAPEHCFFGYYDIPAFSQDGRYHLCHKVSFWDRLPEKQDVAKIGMIDLNTKEFIELAETTAWCFQQGSMLQWHPVDSNRKIIYNTRQNGNYHGVIQDIQDGTKSILDLPVANVDPTGKYALSVNFDRMFDFRPGYGYAGITDKYKNAAAPQEDGVFLIDLVTGKAKLILSLYDIREITKPTIPGQNSKILINHITFNSDGSRFVFLVRNFPTEETKWKTCVVTVNTDGSEPYVLLSYDMASHYWWKDSNNLMIYANGNMSHQLYILKDKTKEYEVLDADFFVKDGHCSYSPDQRWLLYDSYPDKENYRHLYLYNIEQHKGVTLGSYYSYPHITGDFRCDLHPRWNRTGDRISFDSIHEGKRDIYYINTEDCKQLF
jgi:hypothetical protein